MATVTKQAPESRPLTVEPAPPIPPWENGDRLTQRPSSSGGVIYDAMPHLRKAELIEGIVYMPPEIRFEHHGAPHFDLITWLGIYRAATPGVRGSDNSSIRLDLDNMPQPDAFLLVLPSHGGQARFSDDDYVEGAPELAAEVASSSVSYDMHVKFHVYRRNGVREYVVWRVIDAAIDWFVLRDGRYEKLTPGADGLLRSEILPGLWLDPAALLRGDLLAVLDAARQGLASPEHAAFVARLQAAAPREG